MKKYLWQTVGGVTLREGSFPVATMMFRGDDFERRDYSKTFPRYVNYHIRSLDVDMKMTEVREFHPIISFELDGTEEAIKQTKVMLEKKLKTKFDSVILG